MSTSRSPVVSLGPDTTLQGLVSYATDRTLPVYTFLGVPFATPPCGIHRFKPTVPLELWKGMKMAVKYGN